ncbi:MAG: T9SS type A sorting domain-containing protein [Phycisphaerae bacterium]|nr:T9SS type A sorting domain-containing protein [Saprospiraceae bacterium]
MKQLFLSFSLVLATAFSLSAQGNIPQPTHYIVQIAESSVDPIENSSEVFVYYDNNGNTYERKSNIWNGSAWVLQFREYRTLNAQGKPTEILSKEWNEATSTLANANRATIGYHTNGLENYEKYEIWNPISGLWETQSIETTIFGPNDKAQERSYEFYSNGVLILGNRNFYVYDGAGRIAENIKQSLLNGTWTNTEKTDYLYNGADKDYYESSSRNWNEFNGIWGDIVRRKTQTVTSAQQIILSEVLDGFGWRPTDRITNNFDSNDQLTKHIYEEWDNNTSVWTIDSEYEYTYNNDLSIKQLKFYATDFNTEMLYLYALVDYDYNVYAVSTQTPALQAKVSISPNPTADFVRLELEGKEISNITLLDLRGNVLARTTTASRIALFSLANQPPGTYFLRVEQGGATKVLPVVKN